MPEMARVSVHGRLLRDFGFPRKRGSTLCRKLLRHRVCLYTNPKPALSIHKFPIRMETCVYGALLMRRAVSLHNHTGKDSASLKSIAADTKGGKWLHTMRRPTLCVFDFLLTWLIESALLYFLLFFFVLLFS